MTYSAIDARARLLMAVNGIDIEVQKLEAEARQLEAHDAQASVFVREQLAIIRSAGSQINQQAKHICETQGSVVN